MKPEVLIRTARDNFFFAALQWAAMKNGESKYSDLVQNLIDKKIKTEN